MRQKRLLVAFAALYLISMLMLTGRIRLQPSEFQLPDAPNILLEKQDAPHENRQVNITKREDNKTMLSTLGYNITECSTQMDYGTLTIQPPLTDYWQTAVSGQLFVYSAFLDQRHDQWDFVKVIIIRGLNYTKTIHCQLWFDQTGPSMIVKGEILTFPEQIRLVNLFKSLLFLCISLHRLIC
jgi:hypothetical protein